MGYSETGSLFYFKKLLVFFLVTIKNCCSFVTGKEEITFHNNKINCMKKAIWASAHKPTDEQLSSLQEEGFHVSLLKDVNPELFGALTNLKADSNRSQLAFRLLRLECDAIVQPAGDPAFHLQLGEKEKRVRIIFSFTNRVSEDITQPDGSVKKVSIFKHEGWI
jgi:hypothetical protein